MDPQLFELFQTGLKDIKKQNDEQLALLREHIKDDSKVHKVVDRHTIYFQIFTLGIPVAVAYVAKKLGITP